MGKHFFSAIVDQILFIFFSRFCLFCAFTRPRYQVSVYRTIGPLVIVIYRLVGMFRMILQELVDVGNVKISDSLLDANNVVMKVGDDPLNLAPRLENLFYAQLN